MADEMPSNVAQGPQLEALDQQQAPPLPVACEPQIPRLKQLLRWIPGYWGRRCALLSRPPIRRLTRCTRNQRGVNSSAFDQKPADHYWIVNRRNRKTTWQPPRWMSAWHKKCLLYRNTCQMFCVETKPKLESIFRASKYVDKVEHWRCIPRPKVIYFEQNGPERDTRYYSHDYLVLRCRDGNSIVVDGSLAQFGIPGWIFDLRVYIALVIDAGHVPYQVA
jgi:hypothetical protein